MINEHAGGVAEATSHEFGGGQKVFARGPARTGTRLAESREQAVEQSQRIGMGTKFNHGWLKNEPGRHQNESEDRGRRAADRDKTKVSQAA